MSRGYEQTVWNRTLSFTGALSGNIGSWISLTATGPIAATSTAMTCEPVLDWRLLPRNSRFKALNSIGWVGVCWGEDLLWEREPVGMPSIQRQEVARFTFSREP